MIDAALDYTSQGWRVLPLHEPRAGGCTCREGAECSSAGKHPRVTWPADQVVTVEQVRNWWRQWPRANVGIVTGEVSNLLVLDVDPDHGGWGSLEMLAGRYGELRSGPQVITGSGGLHIYYRHPGVRIGPSAGKLGAGLDIRADRGLVVAPPSLHRSGNRYEWYHRDADMPPTPRWMVRALLPPPAPAPRKVVLSGDTTAFAKAVLDRAAEKVRQASDGAKHDVLWRQAFHLGTFVGAGLFDEDTASAVLMESVSDRAKSKRAAEATVRRNIKAGARQPAQVAS